MMTEVNFQIGKNGLNEGVIESLKLAFKKHKTVRISVLKNAVRDKAKVKEIADTLIVALGGNYKAILVGFTIILRKTSKKA